MAKESQGRPTIIVPLDPVAMELAKAEQEQAVAQAKGDRPKSIVYSILDDLQKTQYNQSRPVTPDQQFRLAFDADPTRKDVYRGLYQDRPFLLPAALIKKIHRSDDLVATILNVRANHISMFGRPRASRFDIGFEIVVDPEFTQGLDKEQTVQLMQRVKDATARFEVCGSDKGWNDSEKRTFSQFLKMVVLDGLRYGRTAVEVVYHREDPTKFHSFVPVDAGTIYKIVPHSQDAAQQLREQSRSFLENLTDKEYTAEQFEGFIHGWSEGQYAWIQCIDNRQVQAFRSNQLVVYDFYPITDIEYNGYPLTPLDTIISAVTTHINITQHNKLYFQNGRAARGMLVIKSDSVDDNVIEHIKIQFNASINSVQNSWRMPVFGCGAQEEIAWVPLDAQGHRDAEFVMLSDSNARTILAAFQMAPDEIPGYGHLSRSSNQQSLSESNNQYKLEAARDVGLRPLLLSIQDLLNSRLFPLIDPELSQHATLVLSGLDAEDRMEELARLQVEQQIHATYNTILDTVDKKPLPTELGGDLPLNPAFRQVLDTYLTVGQVLEFFFGVGGASNDEKYAYVRDPFWMQWQQMVQQERQMQAQLEMQQAQLAEQQMARQVQGEEAQRGRDHDTAMADKQIAAQASSSAAGAPMEGAPPGAEESMGGGQQDLTSIVEQLATMISKSEKQMPTSRKRLIAHQRAAVHKVLSQWEQESEKLLRDIMVEAERHSSKKDKP